MEKTQEEIQLENRIYDLAHEITLIFHPEISEGSWVFKNHKEKVVAKLLKDKSVIVDIINP